MEKPELRRLAIEKRNALGEADRQAKSAKIAGQLESLELFQEAESILFYYSHQGEVETLDLMKKWLGSKNLFLPRLTSESSFIALPFTSFDELEMGVFGIPEPTGQASEVKLDLIIVPGLAFDRKGNRLGMGKGFYDRFLSGQKGIPRIALAYSEQVLDQVPKEPYDETINMIVTENEIIWC